jgi:hypothetical protein
LGKTGRQAIIAGDGGNNSGFTLDSCIIHDSLYGVFIFPKGTNHADDVTIKNNLFYDCEQHGIYFVDNGYASDTLVIFNNTVYDFNTTGGNYSGIIVEAVDGLEILNNIVDGNGRTNSKGIALYSCTSVTQNYNNVWDCAGADYTNTSKGANNPDADPLFTTPGSDFTLQAGSPCRNTGATIASVTDDINGIARPQELIYDMGAYEFENPESASESPSLSPSASESPSASISISPSESPSESPSPEPEGLDSEVLTLMSDIQRVNRKINSDGVILDNGIWLELVVGELYNVTTNTPGSVHKFPFFGVSGNIYESHDKRAVGRITTLETDGARIRVSLKGYVPGIQRGDDLIVSVSSGNEGKLTRLASAAAGTYEVVAKCESIDNVDEIMTFTLSSPRYETVS